MSPPVVNPGDWMWSAQVHTCQQVAQLTLHSGAQPKHAARQRKNAALKVPVSTGGLHHPSAEVQNQQDSSQTFIKLSLLGVYNLREKKNECILKKKKKTVA